jgi:hypothetical protein
MDPNSESSYHCLVNLAKLLGGGRLRQQSLSTDPNDGEELEAVQGRSRSSLRRRRATGLHQ